MWGGMMVWFSAGIFLTSYTNNEMAALKKLCPFSTTHIKNNDQCKNNLRDVADEALHSKYNVSDRRHSNRLAPHEAVRGREQSTVDTQTDLEKSTGGLFRKDGLPLFVSHRTILGAILHYNIIRQPSRTISIPLFQEQ